MNDYLRKPRSGADHRLISLPQDLFERLARVARKQDLSVQVLSTMLLERALSEFYNRTFVERGYGKPC